MKSISSPPKIRAFICIEVPGFIHARLEELQRTLAQANADVSWVRTSNIHLTLKFLGAVAQDRLGNASRAVERASQKVRAFEIQVGGTGAFPSFKHPRILWVGLQPISSQLMQLQKSIQDELVLEGFPLEGRSFSPHLTMARLRSNRNSRALMEVLTAKGFEAVTFSANEVIVMRSDLKSQGAVYTRLAVIKLKG